MQQTASPPDSSKRRRKGHAVVEVALLAPWILFLFVGSLDLGFYSYALICTQNAARVAVTFTSSRTANAGDSTGACQSALGEMNQMANVRNLNNCNSLPLIVLAEAITGVDGAPASRVTVTYQTDQLIPIPLLLMGRLNVTRIAVMRVL